MNKDKGLAQSAEREAKTWRGYEGRSKSPIARFYAEGLENMAQKIRDGKAPRKTLLGAIEVPKEVPILEEVVHGDSIIMAVNTIQEIQREQAEYADVDPVVIEVLQNLVDEYYTNLSGAEDEISVEDFVLDRFTGAMEDFLAGWGEEFDESSYQLPDGWEALVVLYSSGRSGDEIPCVEEVFSPEIENQEGVE